VIPYRPPKKIIYLPRLKFFTKISSPSRRLHSQAHSASEVVDIVAIPGRVIGRVHRLVRALVIPVVSGGDDCLGSNVAPTEVPVVGAERPIRAVDAPVVGDDPTVVPHLVARVATQVPVEVAKASVVLLKHDRLSFHIADLFGDNPFGDFLEDGEALLDDFNGLGVTDDVLGGFQSLTPIIAVEVVHSIEIVKAGKGRKASPVVKRGGTIVASGNSGALLDRYRRREYSRCECGGSDQRKSEFGEHGWI